MPLAFKIDHDKRFVNIHTEGVVTLDEILVSYEGIGGGDAMSYPKLFDASTSRLELSSEDLMTPGAWVSAFAQHDPRRPIALLCTTEENENTFRRYTNLGGAKRAMKWLSGERA